MSYFDQSKQENSSRHFKKKALFDKPEDFTSIQIINFKNVKIPFQGIPKQFASNSEKLTQLLSSSLNLPSNDLKFLFQHEQKKLSGFHNAIYVVTPEVCKKLNQISNRIHLIEHYDFAIKIAQFFQPLQCSTCGQLGHALKSCFNKFFCLQCCLPSCSTPKNQLCPRKCCSICFSTDHEAKDRSSCLTYKNEETIARQNLLDILSDQSETLSSEIPQTQTPSNEVAQTQSHLNLTSTPTLPNQATAPATQPLQLDPLQQLPETHL
jgi:hypothetical protein